MKKKIWNKIFIFIFIFLLFILTNALYSQNIAGVVSGPLGVIKGANVLIKGTKNSVQTDDAGKFNVKTANSNAVLVISFVGFKTQEISLGGKNNINVFLVEDSSELKEIVVIGYGSVKKKDATGAVESIKSEAFNRGITTSPEQLLQGKSAGVQVTSTSGEPGAASTIKIRGTSSIRSGSNPLYVVDGVPIDGGDVSASGSEAGIGSQAARNPLNFINPADIASMDLLKDASATAIYGSRGANGVIIITTKKGRKGEGQVTFNTSQTVSTIAHEYHLLNATEFSKYTLPTNVYKGNADAFHSILRTASTQQADFGYSGGNENGNYRFSLGYLDQEGIIKNTGITKYNASINATQKMYDGKLILNGSLITSFIQDETTALSSNVGFEGDVLTSAIKWNPTINLYQPDGSLTHVSNTQRNPLNLLNYYSDNTNTSRVLGSFSATVKLIKGLEYKFNLGVDYSNSNRGIGLSKLIEIDDVKNNEGKAIKSDVIRSNYVLEHTLNYNLDITSKLKMNALLGYSFQEFSNQGNSFVGTGFGNYTDQKYYLKNMEVATKYFISGGNRQHAFYDPTNRLQSYFGRGIFTYDEKYILSLILRKDGSTKFGDNNKFGTFPAFSVAWRIDKEAFMPKVISELKFRGGYGVTGNQEFTAGAAKTRVAPVEGVPTVINIGNPSLRWEQTAQINMGIDFGVFNNRLTGTFDLYKKNTQDALLQVENPGVALYEKYWRNLPQTRIITKGIEFSLNYKIINSNDFSWDFGGNLAFNTGIIKGLNNDSYVEGIPTGEVSGQGLSGVVAQGHFEGQKPYTFYLLQFKEFDKNGISVYGNNEEKAFSGSAIPTTVIGLNTSLRYKMWDFVASGYGNYGGKIYDNTENAMFLRSLLTGGNNVASFVINNGEAIKGNSNSASTRFLHSGDFFRLANLQLGYTFRGGINGFLTSIKTLRLYTTATNIFVITPYKGFDPEVNTNKSVNGISSLGMDYAAYPKSRSFSFGINVSL